MACLLDLPGREAPPCPFPPRTIEDLQLERLAGAMSFSDYYRLTASELWSLFTDDVDVLRRRQDVFRDVLRFPELEGAMEALLDSLDGWEGRSGGRRSAADAFAVGFSLEDFGWLDSYLKKLDAAWQAFSRIPAESEGIRALTALLDQIRTSSRFRDAEADFRVLCDGFSAPAKLRLGYNLDGELKPSRLKLLAMEPWTGEKKKKGSRRQMMLTQLALEMDNLLLQRVSSQASQDISSFVLRETAPLRGLRRDLIVCLTAKKFTKLLGDAALPFCFPELLPAEEKGFRAKGLYDPLLLLNEAERVVPNDAEFRPGGELLFLTGANQGGKTVFLLSVGLCQALGQLGFPVPAAEATLSPAENILTIFAPNGQSYGRRGLLAEETGRIAEAMEQVGPNSLLLFNEPLTSTGPEETKAISAEVIAVCMAAGARGIWVTHVHELARNRSALEEAVPWGSRLGSLRIVLEERAGEMSFTYLVERGEPLGRSYAQEALRRGGVLLEEEEKPQETR
ncbi:MAG: hypothetical protein IKO91_08765 [Oscillospiraceae bacterium]|nr:hypothetical protein [Oscillospiraceae bacterium]